MDETGNDYLAVVDGLESLGTNLCATIREVLRREAITFHTVDYRVKSSISAAEKLQKKPDRYQGVHELMDLLGIRITCYFSDQVDDISQAIDSHFEIDQENSIDKRDQLSDREFGYMSVHKVATLTTARAVLPEYERFANVKFEIQIRSVLQHAWAEIEHDLGYKVETIPKPMKRRFAMLAGVLEMVDREFVHLRNETRAHDEQAVESVRDDRADILALDRSSAVALLEMDEKIHELDRAIADIFGKELAKRISVKYVDRQVATLNALGLTDVATLRLKIEEHRSLLLDFAPQWKASRDSEREPNEHISQAFPRGVVLYYLSLIESALQSLDGEDVDVASLRRLLPDTRSILEKIRDA